MHTIKRIKIDTREFAIFAVDATPRRPKRHKESIQSHSSVTIQSLLSRYKDELGLVWVENSVLIWTCQAIYVVCIDLIWSSGFELILLFVNLKFAVARRRTRKSSTPYCIDFGIWGGYRM